MGGEDVTDEVLAAVAVDAIVTETAEARAARRPHRHAVAVLATWSMRGWAMPGGDTRRRVEQVVAITRDFDGTALGWARDNYRKRR